MRRSAPSCHHYGYLAWTHTRTVHLGGSTLHVCCSVCIRSRAAAVLANSPWKDIWGVDYSFLCANKRQPSIIRMQAARSHPFMWAGAHKHLAHILATHKEKGTQTNKGHMFAGMRTRQDGQVSPWGCVWEKLKKSFCLKNEPKFHLNNAGKKNMLPYCTDRRLECLISPLCHKSPTVGSTRLCFLD